MNSDDQDDDWEEVWDARVDALEKAMQTSSTQILHAPHPFQLGGNADVLEFANYQNGFAYITAELTGKPTACFTDYELMICHRTNDDWGANIISRLAAYTQEAYIGPIESMDIGESTPPGSTIAAFLFDTYAQFMLFDHPNEVRLCVGITKAELDFKMKHGCDKIIELLKQYGVYPFTDLQRSSIPLPS